jgi:arylsulfatase A-like enzyme
MGINLNTKHWFFLTGTGTLVAGLIMICLQGTGCTSEIPVTRPESIQNVILITVDTLRADHLGSYGYPLSTSPVLDRLAEQGSLFTRCITTVPKTAPALASMLTSTTPERHLVYLNEQIIDESIDTLAGTLSKKDIFTAGVQVNNLCRVECGFSRGFNQYIQTCRHGPYQQPGIQIEYINRVVLPWLRDHKDEPFFLWVHYMDPHGPYEPPSPFSRMFDDESYHVPYLEMKTSSSNGGYLGIPQYQAVIGTNSLRKYVSLYDGEIRYWDSHFKAVLQELEELDISRNTAVIITADHGESLVEHDYYFEHGAFLYEQGLHIPLIVKLPVPVFSSHVVGGQCTLLDVAPTILDFFLADPLPEALGKSLLPWLTRQPGKSPQRPLAIRSSDPNLQQFNCRGYTDGNLKYVTYRNPENRSEELFDLSRDPLESYNMFPEAKSRTRDGLNKAMNKVLPDLPDDLREPQFAPELVLKREVQLLQSLGYVDTP